MEIKSENKVIISIKRYTPSQLAKLYGVCRKTFHRWIKPFREMIGKLDGGYFTIDQVKTIFGLIDRPFKTDVQKTIDKRKKSKKVWANERSVGSFGKQIYSE